MLPSDARAFLTALAPFGAFEIHDIALEAGVASSLLRDPRKAGFSISALETVEVSRYLGMRRNKTDRNDALGLAELAKLQLPSVGKVHLKSGATQQLRSKLVLRQKLTMHRVACENMMRSLIRLHGGQFSLPFKSLQARSALNAFDAACGVAQDRLQLRSGRTVQPKRNRL